MEEMFEKIKKIHAFSGKWCTCTKEQLTGVNPSVCHSCTARNALNTLSVDIDMMYRDLTEGFK